MAKQRMLCLECGYKSSDGTTVCPEDGMKLISTVLSSYELMDKLSSDVETFTYSARHRYLERKGLKITLRPRTNADAAEEFIQYARDTAKNEMPGTGTMDLGVTDDGQYMFVVFDPSTKDEVQNPTIEHKILLTETVSELTNPRRRRDE